MHHALMLATRVVAGIVGALAFYFAIFLFEDEQGVWQDRIEQLWIDIHDRAKVTGSTSTALFNKIGAVLDRLFSSTFGKRLLSVRSVLASANTSMATAFLITVMFYRSDLFSPQIFIMRYVPDRIHAAFAALIFFSCAALPSIVRRDWSLVLASIPLFFVFHNGYRVSIELEGVQHAIILGEAPVFIFSVCSDFLVIIVARKSFATISTSLSLYRIVYLVIALMFVAFGLVVLLPVVIDVLTTAHPHLLVYVTPFWNRQLWLMNGSTILFLLLPIIMLIVLAIHKTIWPALSRLLYPVASYRIITDRKILIPIGTVALSFAFNLEHVGAKEILKLLS